MSFSRGAFNNILGFPDLFILAQSAIPFILPPGNGTTIGLQFTSVDGAFSLTTTLMQTAYASAYLWMPIGAFDGTNPTTAGWYYGTFSSTSVGQLYTTTYTNGLPTIPVAPVKPTTTNARWLTQVTSAITMVQITVPGGSMGLNGSLRVFAKWSHIGNTNTKTETLKFGTSQLNGGRTSVSATSLSFREQIATTNRGVLNKQLVDGSWGGGLGTNNTSLPESAIDTSIDQVVSAQGTLTTANTDYIVFEGFIIEILPG